MTGNQGESIAGCADVTVRLRAGLSRPPSHRICRVTGNPVEAQSSALGTARLRIALPEGLSSRLISRAKERAAGSASGEVGPLLYAVCVPMPRSGLRYRSGLFLASVSKVSWRRDLMSGVMQVLVTDKLTNGQ